MYSERHANAGCNAVGEIVTFVNETTGKEHRQLPGTPQSPTRTSLVIGGDGELVRCDVQRLLVGSFRDHTRDHAVDGASVDIAVELGRHLEKLDDLGGGVLAHGDSSKPPIAAGRSLDETRVEQSLLGVDIDAAPRSIGLAQTIRLAGEGVSAIDALRAVGGAEGGVGHAELHVGVVPRDRGVAEVDLMTRPAAVHAGEGSNEASSGVELDDGAGWDGEGGYETHASPIRVAWVVRVALDHVHAVLASGVVEGNQGIRAPEVGDALVTSAHHWGGEGREGGHGGDRQSGCDETHLVSFAAL